jgi:hypothetical protein
MEYVQEENEKKDAKIEMLEKELSKMKIQLQKVTEEKERL